MRKPIGEEIRDQALHAAAGMGVTLLWSLPFILFTKVPPLYFMPAAPFISFIVGLFREWWQHKRIYWPPFTGGSFRDIMFFAIGSLITCSIIIGLLLWTQKML